jgi:hypothetical protein
MPDAVLDLPSLAADAAGISLGIRGFHFGADGMSLLYDVAPSFDDWRLCGEYLRGVERQVQFWIGDWVNYGRAHYGDDAEQGIATDVETIAAQATGWKPETVEQYARVARQVPPMNRDPDLPFAHHREVADRPIEDQRRWLKKAKDENLTTERLRLALKAETSPQADQVCWLVVRCTSPQDRETLAARLRVEGREVKES